MNKTFSIFLIAAVCAAYTNVCWGSAEQNRSLPAQALATHLAKQGNLCLGKTEWPIAVSDQDVMAGSKDAVQMPVLEKFGLVASTKTSIKHKDGAVEETLRRYALTDLGKQYLRPKRAIAPSSDEKQTMQEPAENDFCVGALSLDKLVDWNETVNAAGRREALASYTYKIAVPDWARDPETSKVFPMVARLIQGEGALQLKQRFRLVNDTWVALNPWE